MAMIPRPLVLLALLGYYAAGTSGHRIFVNRQNKSIAHKLDATAVMQPRLNFKGIQFPNVAGIPEASGSGGLGRNNWQIEPDTDERHTVKDLLMDIGGGTGASVSGTGDTGMDQALLRRMRYQDKAVMLLLLMAYAGSLLFSASIAYRQAINDSPVTFYADPRFHNLTTDAEDVDSFLEIFNQPPSDAQLQVTGLVPLLPLPDYVVDAAVMWLGARYRVAFSFALDLSPWLVPQSIGDGTPEEGQSLGNVGVPREDIQLLRDYLATDTNDLSYVDLQKEVEWKDWEELATNIKSMIRQSGFNGYINVRRHCEEVVGVHKNKLWANFMHSRTTKVLLALSVVGWFVYQPYVWLRHSAITIRCKYRVDIGIGQYWPLIAEKIGPDGFNSGVAGATLRSQYGGPARPPRAYG